MPVLSTPHSLVTANAMLGMKSSQTRELHSRPLLALSQAWRALLCHKNQGKAGSLYDLKLKGHQSGNKNQIKQQHMHIPDNPKLSDWNV